MWHNMKWMNRQIGFHIKVQTNIFHKFLIFLLTYILSHVATQSFCHNRLMFQSWKQMYNETFCKTNEVSSTWMHLHTFDKICQDLSMVGCSWTEITSIRLCVTRVRAHTHTQIRLTFPRWKHDSTKKKTNEASLHRDSLPLPRHANMVEASDMHACIWELRKLFALMTTKFEDRHMRSTHESDRYVQIETQSMQP